MQLLIKYLAVVILVLLLASCDCGQIVKGVVLNKHTKQPITGVRIEKIYHTDQSDSYQKKDLSDSSGFFNVHYIAGGVFTCPDFKLLFAKQGYATQTIVYKGITLHDTIYLDKVK